jgi:23S rRNA (cytidine1920-2'-O)/16S rRNA (cytidine1409-2'-O)-methyltransferase
VVRDPAVHSQVLDKVAGYAHDYGLEVRGLIRSPITGPAGNVEFLMHLGEGPTGNDFNLSAVIADCVMD